jgi:hypothetical protein
MNKEEKIKQLLCNILREICDATDFVEDVELVIIPNRKKGGKE